ncbi:dipeptide epimerase [Thermanaerothrix sp.]|uniref:dipeptide epimerase n=1 Tax=Thermanaerothrix sp. TaxID=2972675 RepID=UPI003C7BAEB9
MATPSILHWQRLTLVLRHPFRLSYGVSETRHTYWLRLEDDLGWGEATLPPYYGVDLNTFEAFWEQRARGGLYLPRSLEEVPAWVGDEGSAAARCALEMVALDYLARQAGQPLYRWLDLPAPPRLPTSVTIAIDTPDAMADMAWRMRAYPVLKLKLGSPEDLACLEAVRSARPDAEIRVDANAGWTPDEAKTYLPRLEALGIAMIEQPLPKAAIAEMGQLQAMTHIPIVADESLQTYADVEALAAAGVRGVNVKLMKTGGVLNALRIIRRARELGLNILLGCMIETSLGTTAMAHLAALADWLDLDAPLLIANDPFEGLVYDAEGRIHVPERPGIGVILRQEVEHG